MIWRFPTFETFETARPCPTGFVTADVEGSATLRLAGARLPERSARHSRERHGSLLDSGWPIRRKRQSHLGCIRRGRSSGELDSNLPESTCRRRGSGGSPPATPVKLRRTSRRYRGARFAPAWARRGQRANFDGSIEGPVSVGRPALEQRVIEGFRHAFEPRIVPLA